MKDRNLEEKFQHQIAVVRQAPLKALDAVHPLGIGLVVQLAVEALFHDLVHPAGI